MRTATTPNDATRNPLPGLTRGAPPKASTTATAATDARMDAAMVAALPGAPGRPTPIRAIAPASGRAYSPKPAHRGAMGSTTPASSKSPSSWAETVDPGPLRVRGSMAELIRAKAPAAPRIGARDEWKPRRRPVNG